MKKNYYHLPSILKGECNTLSVSMDVSLHLIEFECENFQCVG